MPVEQPLSSTAKKNIEEIAKVEQRLLQRRPALERVGETISHFFGSIWFIAAHALFIAAWVGLNTHPPSSSLSWLYREHIDPYPFPLLSLALGVEFILLTTFVLMNQKHQMRRNEHWAHLHLQLSMLTEQEVTKTMQLMHDLSRRLGAFTATGDKQLEELARPTSVSAFVGEIEKTRDAGDRLLAEDSE